MQERFVRITRIELENFKNVKHGSINFCNYKSAINLGITEQTDIMAIYGQNGSGKTAMVEAIQLLKCIMSGKTIDKEHYHLLQEGCSTSMSVEFLVIVGNITQRVTYSFTIDYTPPVFDDDNEASAYLYVEKLGFRTRNSNGKWDTVKKISVEHDEDESLSLPRNKIPNEALVELKLLKKYAKRDKKSFFFDDDARNLLESNKYDYINLDIMEELVKFARVNLFVVTVEQLGLINVGSFAPFYFRMESDRSIRSGGIPIELFKESKVPLSYFNLVERIKDQINCVLDSIIPGLQISIEARDANSSDGREFKGIKFKANRYGKSFDLKYESEGIKRIISIMSVLVAMMNNPNVCLVIDEFDSGVFEYLLGQLLNVINDSMKGQLIFTSHNLHALEVLPKEKVVFSTADSMNRYNTLKKFGATNNLRDFYLRAVYLGTQDIKLCDSTNLTAIKKAFRKAGRLYGE